MKTDMLKREASDEHSAIAFITPPITADEVAAQVERILLKPRTELLIPALPGVAAGFLGAWPKLSSLCFHLLRPFGRHRQERYLRKEGHSPSFSH